MRAVGIILISAVVAFGAAACGDDGQGGTQPDDIGTLELEEGSTAVSDQILFTASDEQTRGFRIRNVGTGDLRIDALTIASSPPGAFTLAKDLEGTPFAASDLPVTLPPSGSGIPSEEELVLFITYKKPAGGGTPSATLTVNSNSVRDGTLDSVRVFDLVAQGARPRLQVLPARVDFIRVGPNESDQRTVNLLNQGTEPLIIDEFTLAGNPAFAFRAAGREWAVSTETNEGVLLDPVIEILPGASAAVTVVFTPTSAEAATANLTLFSNDPLQTSGTVVPLAGNMGGPCITVNPGVVNFGGKIIARTATVDVEVTSCGDADLVISELFLGEGSDQNYGLDLSDLPEVTGVPPVTQLGPADNPVTLAPNQSATFKVTYTPDEISPRDGDGNPVYELGEIVIRSNAFIPETRVDVLGVGVEVECPTPVIVVEPGVEVIPQTELVLDGSQSQPANGSITAYRWEVAQPVGSQSVFLPSATVAKPTFEVNVAGTYVFRLSVTDSGGEDSCFPAEATVTVSPDQAIHIELLWDTPGDVDQTDEGAGLGSDMDLHFKHPNARGSFDGDDDGIPDGWFEIPWDTFWHNRHPDWGVEDEAIDDNPGLDRDDLDGGGPENVNLNEPEDGVTYTVGVHYWNDNDYGPSTATVRVFTFSHLVFEIEGVEMETRDMWTALEIAWPSGDVTAVRSCENKNLACTGDADCGAGGVCGEEPRIAPDYIHPFFPGD